MIAPSGTLRLILIIGGMILAIIGLILNNWRLAVIGNTIALTALLFT